MVGCTQFLTITLVFLLKCLGMHAIIVYHIKNSTDASCLEEPCLTLPQFAANVEIYLESNTSLVFLPGYHHLNSQINISAVSNFSMLSSSTSLCCPTVLCEWNAGINFSDIDSVYIGYMRFVGCRGHQAIAIEALILVNTTFTYHSGSAFQFVFSEAKITRSSFISNSGGSLHNVPFGLDFTTADLILIAILGNSYRYPETGAAIAVTQSSIVISDCIFEGNRAEIGGAIFVEKFSNITIIDTVFVQNYATCHLSRCTSGVIYSGNSTIAVFNSTFNGNKLVDNNGLTLLYGGVFGLFKSILSAEQCIFTRNGIENASIPVPHTKHSTGVIIYANNTILNISNSTFRCNSNASDGGALSMSNAVCIITKTKFENNSALDIGGVMTSQNSTVAIYESWFKFNFIKDGYGGVFNVDYTNITIEKTLFENNTAYAGGVMNILSNNIDIIECNFTRNYARRGGVLHMHSLGKYVNVNVINSIYVENFAEEGGGVIEIVGTITIKNTSFIRNNGKFSGAVVCSEDASTMLISDCDFIGNTAFTGGALHVINTNVTVNGGIMERNHILVGLIYAEQEAIISINGTTIKNTYTGLNTGSPIVYFVQSTGYLSHLVLVDNGGLIFALFSNISFNEIAIYSSPQQESATHEGGGAITVVRSKIVFEGASFLNENYATKRGGAIHAIESKIHIYGKISIVHNTAGKSGGGIYLHNSQLNCYRRCLLKLINNTAGDKGGGISAIGSYVSVENTGMIFFQGNSAKHAGGAVSLELNSKLYIIVITNINSPPYALTFTNNSADYGGAVYVADKTNSGTCASESYNILSMMTECFIQLLSVQDYFERRTNYHIIVTMFMDNHAYNSGSNIFGGLLDRCSISRFSEKLYHQSNIVDGATYFTYISDIDQFDSISSEPVRVCFCNEDKQPDCSYHSWPMEVSKGKLFTVPLVAVDQVNNTVPNTTIRSYLLHGGLGENQLLQSTGEGCTDLKFEVYSLYGSEQIILYADGPCKDAPLSQSIIEINFTSCDCPIGFQPNTATDTRCECECNSNLQPYVSDCDPKAQTITREGDFWVDFITETGSYLIHPHCPFDYCKPSNERININLNINNGADVQCANNRSGILCGQCSISTSLSIGSSLCIQCPTYWPLLTIILLIVSVLGGILFVALILLLNLTVAVGTLNGMIFYANIVAANTNSVFPPNVIIAWLNLEPGINICFFDGMTTYWKTWLQLAFPAYVIFLVALVILISEKSRRFSKLIGKKDPVATLATLLLLSYAKLLHTIIASLSGTILKYSTQDNVVVWLPDATIKYLSAVHIPLFITAILVLLSGIAYTVVLFSWQWLLYFKLLNHAPKLSLFIRTYHAPYTPKHRYWTGLLLVARIILYIVFAANAKDDPRINLIAIGVVVVSILIVKDFVEGRGQLYQKRTIEMLEIVCHFNLLILCIVSFFALENEAAKNIFAQISMSFTSLLLLFILLYHLSTECVIKSKLWKWYKKSREQFVSNTTDTVLAEDSVNDFSMPSCSVIEGPKRLSIATVLKGRKGGRIPNIDGAYELKEILLDENIATLD